MQNFLLLSRILVVVRSVALAAVVALLAGPALAQEAVIPGLRLADPDGALAIFNNPAGLAGSFERDLRLGFKSNGNGNIAVSAAAAGHVGPLGVATALVLNSSAGNGRGSVGLGYAPSSLLQVGIALHQYGDESGPSASRFDIGVLSRPWNWLSLAGATQVMHDPNERSRDTFSQWELGLGLRPFAGSDILTLSAEAGLVHEFRRKFNFAGAASVSVRLLKGLYLQLERRAGPDGLSTALLVRTSAGETGGDLAALVGEGGWDNSVAANLRFSQDALPPLWNRDQSAVSVALNGQLSEKTGRGGTHFGRLLLALQQISRQSGTQVVVLKSQGLEADWAQVEELRAAIAVLRKAGKKVLFYADDLGTRTLAIASACNQIWLPPAGTLSARGIGADFLSLSESLARIGVAVQVVRYSDHKSAAEPLVNGEPSPELRASLQHAVERRWSDFSSYVALGRDLTPAAVEAALAAGAAYPPDAQAAHLIDAVVAPGEIDAELRKLGWLAADETVRRFDPPAQRQRTWLAPPSLAVVEIEGNIGDHSDGAGLLGRTLGGTSTAQHIDRLRRDPDTVAVVARISSGGGSVFGSEAMRDALARTAETKPVVASMGGVAASGGYWTALGAQSIFADPGTVTGSIGILMVKPDISQLYGKLGLRTTHLGQGPHSDLYRLDRPWTADELAKIHQQLGRFYGMFLDLTAKRRGLTRAQLVPLTGGRIWFGDEALQHKLIDRTGGLLDAIADAKKRAGLDPDEDIAVRFVPEPTLMQRLQQSLGLAQVQAAPEWLGALQRAVGPWLDPAAVEDLLRQPQPQARSEAPLEGRGP